MSRSARRTVRAARHASWRRWPWLAVALAVLVVAALTAATMVVSLRDGGTPAPRAAIIDQLELTNPNPSLIHQTRQLLADAGYVVEYVPSSRVTVDFYRDLPGRGYELVIIRSHSSGERETVSPVTGAVSHNPLVSLFTAEPYTLERHVADQRAGWLDVVRIGHRWDDGSFAPGVQVVAPSVDRYFGITPEFITYGTEGRFDDTTILLMGCDAVRSKGMVQALVGKGAGIVAGWDGPVTASHTDDALAIVLHHLEPEGRSSGHAVAAALPEIAPDPVFGSTFVAFSED